MKWGIFNKDFLCKFFPREKEKPNKKEFINLCQLDMSVLYYSLKFTKLYAPFVFDPRDEISPFVTRVSHDII